MSVPSWVQDAIFYQIFPDRFANGDFRNDPPNVHAWGSPPTRRGFQGGDLCGITQKMDYLVNLGINAIYLNPIFLSPSTHRYDTSDYYQIDPRLGSLQDFHALVETAHRSGIRVILDGVFNHCSRGFFAFNDILENEAESGYLHWFHVNKFPLRAYESGHARNYQAWWGIKSLPKFNTNTPAVRQYLMGVARYWIEQGADGWRLDVPNEIDDDGFWAEFRETVHSVNPDAYLLGEIWEALPRWANDTHFDGLMNYPVRTAIFQYLTGKLSSGPFADWVEGLLSTYSRENAYAMYVPIGSHDVERVLTYFEGDVRKVKLAMLFQFAYPGAPAIYYGDEVGVEGGKDPDCRRAFPWDPSQWNVDLREWVKCLVAVRKATAALRGGEYRRLFVSDSPAAYAFARVKGDEMVIVVINASTAAASLSIPITGLGLAEGQVLKSLLDLREAQVRAGQLQIALEPMSGIYLQP